MAKFEQKHPESTKSALEKGHIEKEWNSLYRQYFFYCARSGEGGFNSPSDVLDHYYGVYLPKLKAAEKTAQKAWAHDVSLFTVFKNHDGTVTYWHTLKHKWFTVPVRAYRSNVFDLCDEMDCDPVVLDFMPEIKS